MLATLLLLATFHQAYNAYDFATAARAGAPADLQERAWYIANVLRVDSMEGIRLAEEMRATHPESPWSWMALAYAYQDDLDHVDDNKLIAEKLANETNDELVAARAMALNSVIEPDAALKLLDQQPQTVPILLMKAAVHQGRPNDEEAAIAAYKEALRLDPSNTMALGRLGSMLKQLRRRDEAMPLLERAAKVSPYLMATQVPNAAAIDAWVRDSGGDPFVLAGAVRGFQLLKMDDRVCEMQDRILREAPESAQAVGVLMGRARSSMPAWRDLLDYPYRRDPDAIASAATVLIRDSKDDREIVELAHRIPITVENMVRLMFAVQKLADRKLDLDYAEKAARRLIELNEINLLPSKIEPPDMREHSQRTSRASMRDALGWVLLARGKVKEAEKELTVARSQYPESSTIAYHLGRAFEAQKMTTKAEQLYREGLALQTNGVNPNRAALEQLYRRRHNSLAGFEAYLRRASATGESATKERVLASRIAKPHRAPDFRLQSLDGKTVSLADLKGKVAVVNFWGVWCSWCLKEMPDLVRLAKRYADDDRVRIVTVDTDSDPAIVRQWMKEHHYDFPVLLDDGWTHRAGVFVYPTTWFLDPYGRIEFKKEGWTERLVDQFSWRIDVLKK